MVIYIYILSDPITKEIRYVGKTNNLKLRYRNHISVKSKTHTSSWIISLKSKGLRPIMDVIEYTTLDEWEEAEKYWIKYYRDNGYNLTNHTDGGEGLYGHTPYVTTLKITQLRSKIHGGKVLSDKTKQAIALSLFGKRASIETKEKMSNTHIELYKNNPIMVLHIFKLGNYIGSTKSAKEAASIIGCCLSSVLNTISGRASRAGGHRIHKIKCLK